MGIIPYLKIREIDKHFPKVHRYSEQNLGLLAQVLECSPVTLNLCCRFMLWCVVD